MQSKKSAEQKEERKIEISDLVITRASEGTKGTVFFDMKLNGVSVYGLKVVSGKNGDFISWPSKKGADEKYYNYAWAPLTEDQAKGIMMKVQDKLDE